MRKIAIVDSLCLSGVVPFTFGRFNMIASWAPGLDIPRLSVSCASRDDSLTTRYRLR